jgi:hypothetical protein
LILRKDLTSALVEINLEMSKFKFETLVDIDLAGGTSDSMVTWSRLQEFMNAGEAEFAEYMARFRGSVLALFGPPLHFTGLSDEAFLYVVKATDEDGISWILTVCQGPTGPGIGTKVFDKSSLPAATALFELIESTAPADYETVVYDENTDNTIVYGCKAGKSYWKESRGRPQSQNAAFLEHFFWLPRNPVSTGNPPSHPKRVTLTVGC